MLHSVIFFAFFISFASSTSLNASTTHKCSAQQALALLHFKQNLSSINFSIDDPPYNTPCQDMLGSDYYPIMMNWNRSIDCCSWDGVTCNHFTHEVIGLDLSCGMLQGIIHPNTTLFNLPYLERLNLAFNDLTASQLPREIGKLSNSLTLLNLRSTGLQGKLPHNIFDIRSLETLDLSDNRFVGHIPREITLLPKLVLLDLSMNGFGLHIQPYILNNLLSNSTFLRDLWLGEVNIGSGLHSHLNISTSFKLLDLHSTNLQGKLPNNLFSLKYLEELYLGNNSLIGPLPKFNRTTITHLRVLDVSFANLSGEIPNSIGHLKHLEILDLSSCCLTGSLPKSLLNLRHLIFLYLSSNVLSGTLPSWLFRLPSLAYIRLDSNRFRGNVPLKMFSHRSLTGLSLARNQLSGQIDVLDHDTVPQTFQKLTNLKYLDLSSNNFRGDWELDTLLSSLTNLRELYLSYNDLSVTTNNANSFVIPDLRFLSLAFCKLKVFPEYLRAMKNLKSLDLSNNDIHGHIPDWVGEIGGNGLLVLDLSNNSIIGTIPNVFGDCGGLEGLMLSGNQIEGKVPTSLSKCQNLRILDLGSNRLNDTFPSWLGDLPKLQALVLKSNNFHGPIVTSSTVKFPFPSLRVLVISHNEFEGQLPLTYFQNFKAMKNVVANGTKPEYLSVGRVYYSIIVPVKGVEQDFPYLLVEYTIIDLSRNKFESQIPDILGNLNSLKVLNLSHNSLTGQIPHGLGKLSEIESLDLSWNQLSGEIPHSLACITALEVLNLSHNHLVGRIPEGPQFSTFSTSFGGNLGLCGYPLSKCENGSSPQVGGDEKDDEEEESGFTWKVVMLGYGCGTILGLVLGYLMLSTGRPKWFNAIADAVAHMILKKRNKRRYVYIGK